MLTAARLRCLLNYEPETGIFRWRRRETTSNGWNTRLAGKVAGCQWFGINETYWVIGVDGRLYLAHRLAVLYVTGEWPVGDIDHRDLDGLHNAWTNLRPATDSQNGANTRRMRTNTTGFKGVTFARRVGAYQAQIRLGPGRRKWLGYFKTAEDAHAAYVSAATEHFGEFARAA